MVFLAMVARTLSAWASACLNWASAASSSDWAIVALPINSCARARLTLARAMLASAERSIASSIEVSCWRSRSPACTVAPGSKWMPTTLPGDSAATVTPCTAVSEPTALRVGSQRSSVTAIVVTTSGGIEAFAPEAMRAAICMPLIPPSRPTIKRSPPAVMMIFFSMVW